jgi:hypothetical protein
MIKLTLFFLFLAQACIAQKDTFKTVYKQLEVKKLVLTDSPNHLMNDTGSVSFRHVGDTTYPISDSAHRCAPCILEAYDTEGHLVRKSVNYGSCFVGPAVFYHPNGQVASMGRYRANESGDWNKLKERGLCSQKDGAWVFFDEEGMKQVTEYWKQGKFIREVPQRSINEVWKIEILLDGKEVINGQTINMTEAGKLQIKPYFKNKLKAGIDLSAELVFSSEGKEARVQNYGIGKPNKLDVGRLLRQNGFNPSQTRFTLTITNNGIPLAIYAFHLR